MDGCVFCGIIAGRSPASVVWRGDGCTAFMDIQPINAGHVLVAPDGHSACLADLPENTGARMFGIAQRISAALHESGLDCEGVNLFLADGDGFGLRVGPDYANGPDRETLEVTAKRIRDAM